MAEPILVGIDAGTSVIKSVAFALDGTPLAVTFVPNRWAVVPGGGAEQDMQATWLAAAETLRRMGEQVPDLARRLAGIAVTGQGTAPGWSTRAASRLARYAVAGCPRRPHRRRDAPAARRRYPVRRDGHRPCRLPAGSAARLAAAAPARRDRIGLNRLPLQGLALSEADRPARHRPVGGALSFGDFRTRAYSDAVVDALDMAPLRHLLPEIVDGTAGHATLTADAARAAGLLAGTPVVLGYIDIVCSALGAGLYDRDGAAGTSILGSTGMHMRLVRGAANVALPAERTGYTIAFPVDGTYAQMQSNLAATLNIDWMLDLIGGVLASAGVHRDRAQLLAGVDDMLAGTAPGTLLFHPYISEGGERGPFVDVDARAGFFGLSTRHGHADLVRAVFEGWPWPRGIATPRWGRCRPRCGCPAVAPAARPCGRCWRRRWTRRCVPAPGRRRGPPGPP